MRIITLVILAAGFGLLAAQNPAPKAKQLPSCCRKAQKLKLRLAGGQQREEPGDKPGNCGNEGTPQDIKSEECKCHKKCDPSARVEDPKCGRYCRTDKCKCVPPCAT
ncbi:MAG TPA: hypothetical protein VHA30_03660 [Patescibacteria group bacterium]|nr:hypothetical protein [Patescibacteria group bacterium]